MTEQTQTLQYKPWLWPNCEISARNSGRLREEHNALVNSHAELLAVAKKMRDERDEARARLYVPGKKVHALSNLDRAIANAQPAQP